MSVHTWRWILTFAAAVGFAAPAQAQPRDPDLAEDIGKLMDFAARLGKGRLAQDLDKLDIRHRTAHYAMAGTVRDKRLREYGRCLEYIHAEYARGFESLLKERPSRGQTRPSRRKRQTPSATRPTERDPDADRFRVIIFTTMEEFAQFALKYLLLDMEHAGGCYIPQLKLLVILDRPDSQDTYGVLFHEAFHQFFHHYVARPPVWLDEGLATYFETARVTRSRVVFDQPHKHYWKICRKLLENEAAIPLAELIAADRATFYNLVPMNVSYRGRTIPRRLAYYAQAHTLVDMLQHDPQGRRHLQDYIRELAADDGRNTATITAKYFDEQICQALTASWQRHVRGHRP